MAKAPASSDGPRGARLLFASLAGCFALILFGAAAAAGGPSPTDARVPGTRFHATGKIACTPTAVPCQFGVVRGGQGRGEVTVFLPGGGVRTIAFREGRPVRFGGAAVPSGTGMSFRRDGDLLTVRIGSERYAIPDAVLSGG